MIDDVETEQIIVVDRSDLSEVRGIAAAYNVELIDIPASGLEPITTVAIILVGSALAVATVAYLIDKRKGGQVVDLRPGAPRSFYRSRDVMYGLVIIVALNGTATIEVKEPKGMFGIVLDALRGMTADLTEATIEAIAEVAKARFGDRVSITIQPLEGLPRSGK